LPDESKRDAVSKAMRQINQAWLSGRVEDLQPLLHAEIVLVFPGFTARSQGRDELLSGFRDFCSNAKVLEFREQDHQIDVAGSAAVVTFRYEMVYERSGKRSRAAGRDLWIFQSQGQAWIAVWRTMLDMEENAV